MLDPMAKEAAAAGEGGAAVEAESQIAALQAQAVAVQEELAALRKKVGDLERELQVRANLSFDGQFYWVGAGPDKEGPYCQTCYDVEHLLMRLQYRTVEEIDYDTGYTRPGGQIYYKCMHCSRKSKQDLPR